MSASDGLIVATIALVIVTILFQIAFLTIRMRPGHLSSEGSSSDGKRKQERPPVLREERTQQEILHVLRELVYQVDSLAKFIPSLPQKDVVSGRAPDNPRQEDLTNGEISAAHYPTEETSPKFSTFLGLEVGNAKNNSDPAKAAMAAMEDKVKGRTPVAGENNKSPASLDLTLNAKARAEETSNGASIQLEPSSLDKWEMRVLKEVTRYGGPLLLTTGNPVTNAALEKLSSLELIESEIDSNGSRIYKPTALGRQVLDED